MTDNQQFESAPVGLVELIYGVLFNPVRTFRRISHEPPLLYGFLIFFSAVVLTSVTNAITPIGFSTSAELTGALAGTRYSIAIIGALFALIGWFIGAGLFQLLAELFGGKGRAVGVLTVLALAEIPRVLVIPFQVTGYFLAGSLFGRFLVVAASVGVFIWWAFLLVIGLREVQEFSTGRSVATLLVPLGIIGLTIVVFALALVGLIVPFMDGAFPPS